MDKYNSEEKITRFFSNLILLVAFWGGMLRNTYNSDTVAHIISSDHDVVVRMTSGRYVLALFDWIFLKLGMSTTDIIPLMELATILLFTAAMFILQDVFGKWAPADKMGRMIYNACIGLFCLNVFYVEMMMFSEMCAYFGFAYFIAALAVRFYSQGKYPHFLAMLVIAVCAYQLTMIFAAIILAFYIGTDASFKWSGKTVVRELVMLLVCGGMGIINMVSYHVLYALGIIPYMEKSAGVGSISEKFSYVLQDLYQTNYNAHGLIAGYFIPAAVNLFLAVIILTAIIRSGSRIWGKVSFILVLTVGSLLMMYVLPMMEADWFFPPRMGFIHFLIQEMLILTAFVLIEDSETGYYLPNNEKIEKAMLMAVCTGYICINLLMANFIVSDRITSASMDEAYVSAVAEAISAYEEQSGEPITALAAVNDAYASPDYRQVNFHYEQINERIVSVVPFAAIEALSGRNFEHAEMDSEVYDTYFAGKDWNCMNLSEQLVFKDGTAYLCVY